MKRLLSYLALALVAVLMTIGVNATSITSIRWESTTNATVSRSEGTHAVVGNKLYVFGGFLSSNGSYTGTDWYAKSLAQTFEPEVGWKTIAPLPIPLTHAAAVVNKTDIYIAGGYSTIGGKRTWATNRVFKYDTLTNTYSDMPRLVYARGGGGLVILNNQLHYFGGSDGNRIDRVGHYMLDLTGGGWKQIGNMPASRNHLGAVVIGGKIYAVAGQTGTDEGSITSNSLYIYDPATNVWSSGAGLSAAISHHTTLELGGRILVIAGLLKHPNPATNIVRSYDPASNSWTTLNNFPLIIHSGVAGVINGKLYYTGGNFSTRTYRGTPTLVN